MGHRAAVNCRRHGRGQPWRSVDRTAARARGEPVFRGRAFASTVNSRYRNKEQPVSTELLKSLRFWRPIAVALLAQFAGMTPCGAQNVRNSTQLPIVWVLSTGGTISGKGASPTDLSN